MDNFVVSQILASLAFLLGLISFQFSARKSVLLCWFFSALFNAVHFYVLESPEISALLMITSLRFLVASYSTKSLYMYLFISLSALAYLYLPYSPVGYLALIATVLGAYGSFRKNDKHVRLFMMAVSTLWITHNVMVWTPVAAIMEVFFLASNVLGYWRFHIKKKEINSG